MGYSVRACVSALCGAAIDAENASRPRRVQECFTEISFQVALMVKHSRSFSLPVDVHAFQPDELCLEAQICLQQDGIIRYHNTK